MPGHRSLPGEPPWAADVPSAEESTFGIDTKLDDIVLEPLHEEEQLELGSASASTSKTPTVPPAWSMDTVGHDDIRTRGPNQGQIPADVDQSVHESTAGSVPGLTSGTSARETTVASIVAPFGDGSDPADSAARPPAGPAGAATQGSTDGEASVQAYYDGPFVGWMPRILYTRAEQQQILLRALEFLTGMINGALPSEASRAALDELLAMTTPTWSDIIAYGNDSDADHDDDDDDQDLGPLSDSDNSQAASHDLPEHLLPIVVSGIKQQVLTIRDRVVSDNLRIIEAMNPNAGRRNQPQSAAPGEASGGASASAPADNAQQSRNSGARQFREWDSRSRTSGTGSEESGRNRRPPLPSSRHQRPGRLLACPFAKKDPQEHGKCYSKRLRRMRDVREHLYKEHLQPIHCPGCKKIHIDHASLQAHIAALKALSLRCPVNDRIQHAGVTPAQKTQLARRLPIGSVETQWFGMFGILFPDHRPGPASPYVDDKVEQERGLQWSIMEQDDQRVTREGLRRSGYGQASGKSRLGIVASVLQGSMHEVIRHCIDLAWNRSLQATQTQNKSTKGS
jgi:hypothetical protein